MLDKPIVYLVRDWERYMCAKQFVLNESAVEVFFPDHVNSSDAFLYSIARAKAFTGPSRAQARRDYMKLYFGDLDGYEEYRVLIMLLRGLIKGSKIMAREVARLEELLSRFSSLP